MLNKKVLAAIALALLGSAGVVLVELAWHDMVKDISQEHAIHLGSVFILAET